MSRFITGPVFWQALMLYCFLSLVMLFTLDLTNIRWLSPWVLGGNSFVFVRFFPRKLQAGQSRRKSIRFIQGLMAVIAGFSIISHILVGVYSHHFLRSFFDFVMPCCWVALLASPSIQKWVYVSDTTCDGRCSIADLLLLTFVVAISTLVWLALAKFTTT